MKSEARYEDIIRCALKEESAGIEATEDSLKKVKERIITEESFAHSRDSRVLRQRLSGYFNAFYKYKPAAVLFCIVLLVSLVFVFSEQVRVLAKEGVEKLVTLVYVVAKGEDGKYDTVQVPVDSSIFNNSNRFDSGEMTFLDDDELSKEAGFNTKTPENLINGYTLWITSFCKTKDPLKNLIRKDYYRGSERLFLEMSTEKELFKYKIKVTYEDHQREFKVENILVEYYQSHIPIHPFVTGEETPQMVYSRKPIKIVTENIMEWNYNGVYYHLSDGSSGVSLEELNEVTVSLIKDLIKSN